MYSRVKIAVMSLVVIAACMISSSGTLSYFMDSKGVVNNFTVGNATTTLAVYDDISGDRRLLSAANYAPIEDGGTIPFYPQAQNTGNIPVYQRFRIVIPIALRDVVTLNLTGDSCEVASASSCDDAKFTVIYNPSVMVNNVETYAEYYIVSNQVLSVGETTAEWPMTGVVFSNLEQGSSLCPSNSNNCIFGVGIYSDVMQTTGFAAGAVNAFESFTETYN